jgi:phosphate uptake regulator
MNRKAIQLANNTLVVSLPAKWVKQNSIQKGSELDVDMKETLLVIRKDPKDISHAKKASIDISGMSATLVWNYLNAVYRTGVNEIEVFFSDHEIKNLKTGSSQKTMDLLSRITDKLIGVEIIRQSKSSCILKEITQLKGDEYANVLNRIFLSLITMANDVLEASSSHDKETLENLYMYSEININKLSDYCMRILNLQGLRDFKDSNSNYLTTFLLEEVGDCYAQIARVVAQEPKAGFIPDTTALFNSTNELLRVSHKFHLNPKKEYYLEFHARRNKVKQDIDALFNSKKKPNIEVLFLLKSILDKLMEVNNAKVTVLDGF